MKLNALRPRGIASGLTVLAVTLTVAAPAIAQDLDFEEIIVRAQKRGQSIMEVPVAVTAVTGAAIQDSGIKDVFALLQNVPGLIVGYD